MTQLATDLLAIAPATPGKAPGISRVDGAATGSFARLLSDAELQPDTLEGTLTPEPGFLATADGEPLLLALPPTLVAPEAALAGSGGEPLPATGNDLPADVALPLVTGEPGGLPTGAAAAAGAAPTAQGATDASVIADSEHAATLTESGTALAAAVVAPTVADESSARAADVARSAPVPVAVAETTARALRSDPAPIDRSAPPAATPTLADEAVAPAIPVEAANKPVAAFAEVAAAEPVARPDAAGRAAVVEATGASAGQDPLARQAPLDSPLSGAARGPAVDAPARMTIDQPFNSPAWADALGKRVLVMTDTRLRSAEIRMDPPELGPIEVQLTVKDDKAHVSFQAQHALTRDAIESAMPRLREMLSEQGLVLGQATVSDQSAGESGRFSQGDAGQAGVDDGAAGESDDSAQGRSAAAHAGLIDEYA